MSEIIRHLNSSNVKTSLGNEFGKNSIRRILCNKKYIGIYTYKGVDRPDIIQRIVDHDTFNQAQIMLEKTKKLRQEQKLNKKYI